MLGPWISPSVLASIHFFLNVSPLGGGWNSTVGLLHPQPERATHSLWHHIQKKKKKTQSETYCHASVSFHFHECESPNQLVNTKPCRRPRFLWPDGHDCRTLQCKIYFTLYFSIIGRTSHNSRLFIYLDATATIHCPHTDPLPQVYICLQRHWDHTQTHPANGIIVDYRALWCMS